LGNLDHIKERGALEYLGKYEGKNPYIKGLKREFIKKGKLNLTITQAKYILDNHNKEPLFVNKVVGITEFLGKSLQEQYGLSFVPERILIEYILADGEKTFHIYGKLKRNQKQSRMYFIPKTQVMDDPYFEDVDVEVDFDKYTKLDTFVLADGTVGRTPYEHQKSGVKFLLPRNGCVLADDMGLGKSYQAIIAALEKGVENILIVCPSSVKINWEREINYFQCYDTSVIEGRKWNRAKFTIINYDILKNFHTIGDGKKKKGEDHIVEFNREMVNSKFDLVIIDEAHYLKNHKSIRGQIMVDLCVKHGIETVWLLTGTPIANRPMDYYNLLKLIKAPVADNWKYFAQRYCEGRKIYKTLKNGYKRQIWLTNGASNLQELSIKTRNIMLRRDKSEIKDMPDKTITPVYHSLSKRGWDEYDGLWDEYLVKRKEDKKKGTPEKDLVELILLRKFIAMEAIPHTIELTQSALDQEQKVIIFTTFTDELLELQEHFGKECVVHYGPMSNKDKQNSIDEFQNNDKVKVFIGNVKSAGVGITLTKGTVVVFNSFDWVPGNNEQAEDRAYRIGQENNVSVYYQLFDDTISVKMWGVLKNKKEVIATIMGEREFDEEEIMLMMADELMEDYDG
jgi:SWI/SNF-related matrix-associated actin-dependent regulator 1 of chromatin subfamily A